MNNVNLKEFFDARRRPPPQPAAPVATFYAFEVLDAAKMRAIDATLPPAGVLRLEAPFDVTEIQAGGVDVLRLERTGASERAIDPGLKLWTAIVESAGSDETTKACAAKWADRAEAWARGALARLPSGPIPEYRMEPDAVRAMVADRLHRSFLLPAADVERIAGAPAPARGLWPIGRDADALEEAALVAAEAAAAAAAEARRVAEEKARIKSVRELRIVAIEVARNARTGKLADETIHRTELAEGWSIGDKVYFVCKDEAGLSVPPVTDGALRVLGPEELAFVKAPPMEPAAGTVELLRALRATHAKHLDWGPVKQWSDDGVARGREIAQHMVRYWVAATPPLFAWRRSFLPELLVRGLLIEPPLAAMLILDAADAQFDAGYSQGLSRLQPLERQEIEKHRPSVCKRDEIGALCVKYAQGTEPGGVGAGELLNEPAPEPVKVRKTKGG